MKYFCTYFDRYYLDKGLALHLSLMEQKSPFTLFILCLDEMAETVLSQMKLTNTELISLRQIEGQFPILNSIKENRPLLEYYFTITPFLPLYIIEKYTDVDIITYLDADLYFFAPWDTVFQELGEGSILIVPHRFAANQRHLEAYGVYNVGLISIRNDNNGISCLQWWGERCLEWCGSRIEYGKFADQKYLDEWPSRFQNVIISKNPGLVLGPWNAGNCLLDISKGFITVDGVQLIVYHFHHLERIHSWLYNPNIVSANWDQKKFIHRWIYTPYICTLHRLRKATTEINWTDNSPLRDMTDGKTNPHCSHSVIKRRLGRVMGLLNRIRKRDVFFVFCLS